MKARASEKRKVLVSFMKVGAILKMIEKGIVGREGDMLYWKDGTPLTETHELLKF